MKRVGLAILLLLAGLLCLPVSAERAAEIVEEPFDYATEADLKAVWVPTVDSAELKIVELEGMCRLQIPSNMTGGTWSVGAKRTFTPQDGDIVLEFVYRTTTTDQNDTRFLLQSSDGKMVVDGRLNYWTTPCFWINGNEYRDHSVIPNTDTRITVVVKQSTGEINLYQDGEKINPEPVAFSDPSAADIASVAFESGAGQGNGYVSDLTVGYFTSVYELRGESSVALSLGEAERSLDYLAYLDDVPDAETQLSAAEPLPQGVRLEEVTVSEVPAIRLWVDGTVPDGSSVTLTAVNETIGKTVTKTITFTKKAVFTVPDTYYAEDAFSEMPPGWSGDGVLSGNALFITQDQTAVRTFEAPLTGEVTIECSVYYDNVWGRLPITLMTSTGQVMSSLYMNNIDISADRFVWLQGPDGTYEPLATVADATRYTLRLVLDMQRGVHSIYLDDVLLRADAPLLVQQADLASVSFGVSIWQPDTANPTLGARIDMFRAYTEQSAIAVSAVTLDPSGAASAVVQSHMDDDRERSLLAYVVLTEADAVRAVQVVPVELVGQEPALVSAVFAPEEANGAELTVYLTDRVRRIVTQDGAADAPANPAGGLQTDVSLPNLVSAVGQMHSLVRGNVLYTVQNEADETVTCGIAAVDEGYGIAFSFAMPDVPTGTYRLCLPDGLSDTFYYTSRGDREALETVVAGGNAEEIRKLLGEEQVQEGLLAFGALVAEYRALPDAGQQQVAENIAGLSELEQILAAFDREVVVGMCNAAADTEVRAIVENPVYAAAAGLSLSDGYLRLTDENKTKMTAYLAGANIADGAALQEAFRLRVFFALIHQEPWGEWPALIRANNDLLELRLPQSEDDLNTAVRTMKNAGVYYTDVAAFVQDFADALPKEQPGSTPPGSTGGGGSGGGGSRGTGGASVALPPREDTEPTAPDGAAEGFSDLAGYDWASDAIAYLAELGVVTGVAPNRFAPADPVTREQFLTMLVRAFDLTAPETAPAKTYTDVPADAWYAESVAICSGLGICEGYPDGRFGVGEPITRQDIAVLCHRVGLYLNIPFGIPASLDGASDRDEVSPYAQTAMGALCGADVLQGMGDGRIAPLANAGRAEAAVMTYRLMKLGGAGR